MSLSGKSGAITVAIGVVVILFAIAITQVLQEPEPKSLSLIRVYGPVWNESQWVCKSSENFLLHFAFRGINNAQIAIDIPGVGTQSLYELDNRQLESFTVGASANDQITITRTGTVSGFITLQTVEGAQASCTKQN